jgi:hypothetical protein
MVTTFQAVAVVVLAVLPGGLYVWGFEWLWATYVRSGTIARGEPLPLALWVPVLLYAGIPFALGTLVAKGTQNGLWWAEIFTGPNPAPRAWDHFFFSQPDGWMRLHLKSGIWVGGAFAPNDEGLISYAAGYPDVQDLFLARTVEIDPETGVFLTANEEGEPVFRESSLLIRWDEVEYLEFIDA